MCKLRPLLQKWVEEADNNENLQEIGKAETLVQARKRKRSIENRVRGNLESMFLQCPKPTLQQISHIAQQLGLEKDVVRVWFCNHRQKGKRSSSDYSQRKDFEAAGSPFARGPVSFPQAPGPHFGTPGYGGPHFTTLYSSVPFPEVNDLGEPPPATSSPPDQSPTHTHREEGAPALGEREVWKGPGEVTQYLSLRAAGSDADDRVGGEGIRWARVLAGSGGPWASAPPSAAASCRRSPGCARRSAGYLWPSRLARRPLGPPPRPPALRGWGRSAPQRPVRERRRPGARSVTGNINQNESKVLRTPGKN
ncbi:hypothetical protein AB1E18_007274 [Capra hircus]